MPANPLTSHIFRLLGIRIWKHIEGSQFRNELSSGSQETTASFDLDQFFPQWITSKDECFEHWSRGESMALDLGVWHPTHPQEIDDSALRVIAFSLGDERFLLLVNWDRAIPGITDKFQTARESHLQLTEAIRQQRKINADLEKARREAIQLNQMKSQVVAQMTHEVRTPLSGMLGTLALLQRTTLDNHQQQLVDQALGSARDLRRISNDVLDYSKMELGKLTLSEQRYSLGDVVRQVVSQYRPTAETKQLQLTFEVDPSIPPLLWGDPYRLKQIMNNLVDNALKFTHQGMIHINAALAPGNQQQLRIQVRDTGIGIPKEKLQSIFESFTQAHATSDYGGFGLGLHICHQLATLMNGKIGVTSHEEGSEFTVTLPLTTCDNDSDRSENSVDPLADTTVKPLDEVSTNVGKKKRILLVEDHDVNRIVVTEILESESYIVTMATDGEEAIAAFQQQSFDGMVLDCQLPKLSGDEVVKRVRAIEQDSKQRIPIVMLTAYALPSFKESLIQAGADGFVAKPFEPDELIHELKRVMQRNA
ncbi:MAG: ATP-binding protein [Pirellulaceae bacterium]